MVLGRDLGKGRKTEQWKVALVGMLKPKRGGFCGTVREGSGIFGGSI